MNLITETLRAQLLAKCTLATNKAGVVTLVILDLLAVFAFAIDYVAAIFSAKKLARAGLPLSAQPSAPYSDYFFGFPCVIFGTFVGAALGEFIVRENSGNLGYQIPSSRMNRHRRKPHGYGVVLG